MGIGNKIKNFFSTDLDNWLERQIGLGIEPGVFCTEHEEPVPTFRRARCEKVFKTYNNSFIVMGKDRNESLASGAGGNGDDACAMIDIVVGRGATYSAKRKKPLTREDMIGPSFSSDAARIYISQKTYNIDEYFGFENTKTSSHSKSSVALKSDHTRVIARESLRFYCGPGSFGGMGEKINSNGALLETPKIEIIAGHENKLQPMVRGMNLVHHLMDRSEKHRELCNSIIDIFEQLAAINATLATLALGAPPFSTNVIKSLEGLMGNVSSIIGEHIQEINDLDKGLISGHRTILSNSVYST